ncbi:MAG: DUF1016 domain-containing protein [Desulfobacterales bacterium]|nr:DUF1016 domain-containing protein [Desulfobacterales bacterium]
MSESALEDALLDKLQDFLLELGHGFCFEASMACILKVLQAQEKKKLHASV